MITLTTCTIPVVGMMCAACSANVERRLASLLGIQSVSVSLPGRSALIEYDPDVITLADMQREVAAIGYDLVIDGTNASDDIADRPGYKALGEEGVLSPLRLCGITKQELRERSREAGLFTWSKPAYACLATRIPTGETITAEKLHAVEQSEDKLFRMGFTDFRVRTKNGAAKLQFIAQQHGEAARRMEEIKAALTPYFTEVSLDPEPREKSK